MRRSIAFLSFAACMGIQVAHAETLAVTNARIAIGDGSATLPNATLLVRDGRVVATGADIGIPEGAEVLDAGACWVTPGLIAANTTLGLIEGLIADEGSNDIDSPKSAYSASLSVADSINPAATDISYYRAHGFTRAFVLPGAASTIFRGLGAVISTRADFPLPYAPETFLVIELGEGGAAIAGGSRAAAISYLRQALADAAAPRLPFVGRHELPGRLSDTDLEAVRQAIDGRIPVVVLVERRSDIRSLLAIRKAHPKLRMAIVGASEAWLEAEGLNAGEVAVIAAPLSNLPMTFERIAATPYNLPRLEKTGVTVAVGETGRPADTRQAAAALVALDRLRPGQGMDWNQALAAITSGPAKAVALDGDIGSLLPGRRADFVIWDGDPLEPGSGPVRLFIDGAEQPLATRQTLLRQRYGIGSADRSATGRANAEQAAKCE